MFRPRTVVAFLLGAAILGACNHAEAATDTRARLEAYVESSTFGFHKAHLMAYAATYDTMLSARDDEEFQEAFGEMPKQEACLFAQFGRRAFTFSRDIRDIASDGVARQRNQERYFKLMQNTQPYRMSADNDPCS